MAQYHAEKCDAKAAKCVIPAVKGGDDFVFKAAPLHPYDEYEFDLVVCYRLGKLGAKDDIKAAVKEYLSETTGSSLEKRLFPLLK